MNKSKFFEDYYKNAGVNCILIMDSKGKIIEVNNCFTKNFGYRNKDIAGKNFSILFSQPDIKENKHLIELEKVNTNGQANDDNYIIDKHGYAIWCTGECLLITNSDEEKYIVKDIVNLQTKKQVQLILTDTEMLLERVFNSTKEFPMMVLNGSMRINKLNDAFLEIFEIDDCLPEGSRLSDIAHPFWQTSEIKKDLRQIIINKATMKEKDYLFKTKNGEQKRLRLNSLIIKTAEGNETKIYIMFEELSETS